MTDEKLAYLVELINQGFEYPDAEWKTAQRFKFTHDEVTELRNQYDERG